jgi:hypothetical protein
MSNVEREKVRQAGAEDARRSRIQQGLPERIEDAAAVAILAALLKARPSVLSGKNGRLHGRKTAALSCGANAAATFP